MTKEQAKAAELRDKGFSYRKIGKQLGYSNSTIQRWLKPDYAEKCRQRTARNHPKWRKANQQYDKQRRANNPEYCKRESERGKQRYANGTHPAATYFIQCPLHPGRVTIGTTLNLTKRMNYYAKCPMQLRLLAVTPIPERAIHQFFARERIHGEIFRYSKAMRRFVESECVIPQCGTLWDKE